MRKLIAEILLVNERRHERMFLQCPVQFVRKECGEPEHDRGQAGLGW